MPAAPRPPRRARGTCRWVSRRHRVLRLNGALYTAVRAGAAYRLLNWSSGNVYAVDAAGRWCTCPSFVWDHCPDQAGGDGRCKHIAALRALGLLPGGEDSPRPALPQGASPCQNGSSGG